MRRAKCLNQSPTSHTLIIRIPKLAGSCPHPSADSRQQPPNNLHRPLHTNKTCAPILPQLFPPRFAKTVQCQYLKTRQFDGALPHRIRVLGTLPSSTISHPALHVVLPSQPPVGSFQRPPDPTGTACWLPVVTPPHLRQEPKPACATQRAIPCQGATMNTPQTSSRQATTMR